MRRAMTVLVAGLLLSFGGRAAWAQNLAGDWQGTLKAGEGNGLRVVLRVSKDDKGGWEGMLYSIDQGPEGMAVRSLAVSGDVVRFAIPAVQGSYEGKLNAGATAMVGSWTQGKALPLELDRATRETAWQTDASPHKVMFVPVEKDVKLEVLDWGGTGRAMVLLAGLGNSAHVFDTFAPKLTGKFHVYGITRRGFGVSSSPEFTAANYSADRLGDDVLAVMSALKLDRPVVAGHSIAGEELSSIGSRHAERVAGLVYLDAGYGYAFYDKEHGDFFLDVMELRHKLEQLLPGAAPTDVPALVKELRQTTLPRFEKELEVRQQMMATMPAPPSTSGPAPPPNAATAILAGQERYTEIHGPVLAIFAIPHSFAGVPGMDAAKRAMAEKDDAGRTEPQVKAFAAGVPTAHVVRLANADHYVFKSNEADVLREMEAFAGGLR